MSNEPDGEASPDRAPEAVAAHGGRQSTATPAHTDLVPAPMPFYCEENAWHRARQPDCKGGHVVFVSNPARQVAIFEQRAGRAPDGLVVWDYHVVVVSGGHVHDPDHRPGAYTPLRAWAMASFPAQRPAPEDLRPGFRVVKAPVFVEHFRSDRAHMRRPDGTWRAPPPPWPPIGPDPAAGSNLMAFVDMEAASWGQVLDLEALICRYGAA